MGRETNKNRREKQAASAREKAAAARADARRQEQRRRAVVVISTVAVIAVVAVVIVVIAINRPTKSDPSGNRVTASSSVLSKVAAVSDATLDKVGAGNVATPPAKVTGQQPLTSNGKPEVLFIGAEFCPYCAVERWSLYSALSKFGTFKGVGEIRSATDDGNYASLDFYKSTYTSKWINFTAVENEDRNSKPLQAVTAAQAALWKTISGGSQGFPFVDYGNKYANAGSAPLDPSVLGSLTQEQIAGQLDDPSSKVAQTIDGGTNEDIAAICALTNNQPSTVCSRPIIKTLQAKLSA